LPGMEREEMQRLFERHRDAEAARDYDGILDTFVEDCFLETEALGLRSDGREAVRRTYEEGYFVAFPDLAPDDVGQAFGDDVMVVWGTLEGTSGGEWMGWRPPASRSRCRSRT
jgi:ketosteroid isomerase-like protein